jgi:uncharacterized membrane protein
MSDDRKKRVPVSVAAPLFILFGLAHAVLANTLVHGLPPSWSVYLFQTCMGIAGACPCTYGIILILESWRRPAQGSGNTMCIVP